MAFIHLLLVIYACVYVNTIPIDGSSSSEAEVQCNMCVDRFNWTNCDDSARARNCSDELVLATHKFLAQYNIHLNGSTTTAERQFRCFRLELEIDVTAVQVFIRGCTYDDSFFCDGWTENGATATNCAVCSTRMCERNTTGDVASTTTTETTYLPPKTTTTTTAVTTTGASSTTQSASTTPKSPMKTTLTTDEPCIVVDWTTTTTAKKRPTTSTTKVVGEVTTTTTTTTTPPSQGQNLTTSTHSAIGEVKTTTMTQTPSSHGQDLTTTSTDTAEITPSLSDTDITPAPYASTTTAGARVHEKYVGIHILILLLFIGSFFMLNVFK